MNHTALTLQGMAFHADTHGIHTGDQFAAPGPLGPRLDICAIAYMQAEGGTVPPEFYNDEDASIRLIESSAGAMAAIRAISDALDSNVCETEVAPGCYVPDYIDHVSNWVATASPVSPKRLPTVSEVIGRILRAANRTQTAAA